jgi:ribose transport system substrate-binding protein
MHGFVLQNPFEMGYLAVKTAVQHLQGQKVPPLIDTGVQVVTTENVNTPEMKRFLEPPVAEYLK